MYPTAINEMKRANDGSFIVIISFAGLLIKQPRKMLTN